MKVLICVASRHEATAQIAEVLARTLSDRGLDVRTLQSGSATAADVDDCDALILGSAVYLGRWMAEARDLVDRVGGQLNGKPVWLFSSGPVGDPPQPAPDAALDMSELISATAAQEHRLFGGRLARKRLGVVERTLVAVMRVRDSDNRQWEQIRAWGEQIAGRLRATSPPA
ncbi:hypothetical protein KGA66_00575 [Actinocrinis puniceicyclus]|uniref:Flavodoxin-like domain-containing protein n=1 Tax=Actinocrinis puniceicyclus TaxID=977794 RepID=A0A8J7WL56_9ACTN|nr:flavodoxin domain-containing protein [Actinocrinis puniceicyclus]MBS2961519.1 hypothetical protein [Actinocrinis puniceicyclus]